MNRLKKILSGEILQNEFLKKNIKFLIFIFLLFFCFVILEAIGDFKVAKIQKINSEIAELRENYVYVSSELMQLSLMNNVQKEIEDKNMGLEIISKPPLILQIKNNETDKKKK